MAGRPVERSVAERVDVLCRVRLTRRRDPSRVDYGRTDSAGKHKRDDDGTRSAISESEDRPAHIARSPPESATFRCAQSEPTVPRGAMPASKRPCSASSRGVRGMSRANSGRERMMTTRGVGAQPTVRSVPGSARLPTRCGHDHRCNDSAICSSISRSSTTGNGATRPSACEPRSNTKHDNQRQRHESSNPTPPNPGQPRASTNPGALHHRQPKRRRQRRHSAHRGHRI